MKAENRRYVGIFVTCILLSPVLLVWFADEDEEGLMLFTDDSLLKSLQYVFLAAAMLVAANMLTPQLLKVSDSIKSNAAMIAGFVCGTALIFGLAGAAVGLYLDGRSFFILICAAFGVEASVFLSLFSVLISELLPKSQSAPDARE